jgi:pimeloyl-ACP methyl ester carboxylesterase
VIGFSAGGGYALACAARMPERISAVGLACCEGPYDKVPDALDQGMTPEERTLFERIRRDPTAARLAVAEHVAWYQDPDTIWEWEPPAVDVPILARPDVREGLTLMFREGARQGVGGLVDDWIALSLPWGFDLAEVQLQAGAVPSRWASAVAAALERHPWGDHGPGRDQGPDCQPG